MRRSRDGIDQLHVPTVVLIETVRGYDRHHRQAFAALSKSVRQFERLRVDMEDFQLSEDLDELDETDPYENWLREELAEHEVHLCDPPDNALQELINRATLRSPPFDANGNGFRDGVLWLSILRFVGDQLLHTPIVFVSGDHRAFWSDNGLDPALVADIATAGTNPAQFRLFDTVSSFVRSLITEDPAVHNDVADLVETELPQLLVNLEALLSGRVLGIYGAFGEATILNIGGDSQLVVEEVGALENTNDFLVSLTLDCTLLVEVVGYDPDADLYLDGEWRIDRAIPVTGVWDTNQQALDNLTIGQIDDLYPQEVLV